MLKKVKQSKSEKVLLTFLVLLAFFSFSSFYIIKNKCLFVEDIDVKKINFNNPENISIMSIVKNKPNNNKLKIVFAKEFAFSFPLINSEV